MTRAEQALENKKNGMNCAQSVVAAFADCVDVPQETLLALSQPLGVGIGGSMEGTCGALTGACIIVGLMEKGDRATAMRKARMLVQEFKEKNQVVTCKALKGIDTGVVIRECNGCVQDAAEMLERLLLDEKE